MNFKLLIIFLLSLLISGCQQNIYLKKKESIPIEQKYKNTGFALILDGNLEKIKSIDDRSLLIYHKKLKKKSIVKITNPRNGKSLIAQVKSNRQKFSNFYNSVISKRIAEDLELDFDEPYLEIILISKDSTFIAKKTKTFEEEKTVAEKAPIDGIQINDLNKDKENKKVINKETFSYSIKIADFYYENTAELMITRIRNQTTLKKIKIQNLSKTKFRVLIGPFNDIKTLRESFEKLNSLDFENLEILKNV